MKHYEQPLAKITFLCSEDIVTASVPGYGDNEGHTPEDWLGVN